MTPAAVELGDIVSVFGVRCRVRHVAAGRVWLVVFDPCPLSIRRKLQRPVDARELDPPQPAAENRRN